ncbi:MAG TPA: hypothetical protein PK490_06775 [Prosthecobacter sp.]|nr:hypothetical protein [Prosthecobacter sp.]HRK13974.1 hypothetical protein [Prosthecobacter sp.]
MCEEACVVCMEEPPLSPLNMWGKNNMLVSEFLPSSALRRSFGLRRRKTLNKMTTTMPSMAAISTKDRNPMMTSMTADRLRKNPFHANSNMRSCPLPIANQARFLRLTATVPSPNLAPS